MREDKLSAKKIRGFKNKKAIKTGLIYLSLTLGGVTMILPFLWMISTSLKSYSSIFIFNLADIQWIPKAVYWKNYVDVWKVVPFAVSG